MNGMTTNLPSPSVSAAAKDARHAAEQFANDSGSRVVTPIEYFLED